MSHLSQGQVVFLNHQEGKQEGSFQIRGDINWHAEIHYDFSACPTLSSRQLLQSLTVMQWVWPEASCCGAIVNV